MDAAADSNQHEQALRRKYRKMNSDASRLSSARVDATCAFLISGNKFSKQQSGKHQKPGVTDPRSNDQSFSFLTDQNEVQFQQLHNNPRTQSQSSKKTINSGSGDPPEKFMIVKNKIIDTFTPLSIPPLAQVLPKIHKNVMKTLLVKRLVR